MFYSKGGATFIKAPQTGICYGTFEIVPQEVLWSIWGSHQTLWSLPLPNVTWHSGTWPYTMTPSIDQTLHQFANLLPNWTLVPILTSLLNFGGFHRTLQRVRLANRGRLLHRTPGPVPLGLAFILMLRPFFPELVMSTDLLSFEHPSVLLRTPGPVPLGLAFVLMLRPFFPELVMSTDLLSFEHPSVLLLCPSMEHLHPVWHSSRDRLPLRTPGSVPNLRICLCSNRWDKFYRTCHVFLDFSPWKESVCIGPLQSSDTRTLFRLCIEVI